TAWRAGRLSAGRRGGGRRLARPDRDTPVGMTVLASAPLPVVLTRTLPWREPLAVACGLSSRDGALALLSDGGPGGRWSHIGAEPDVWRIGEVDDARPFQ